MADARDAEPAAYDFGVLLGLSYQVFVDQLNAALGERGFTDIRPAFGYVFRALADRSITATQLAARLGITAQGAGKLVDQMVAAGYVQRHPDATDRRTRWLKLTPRGYQALAAAREIHHALEQRLAAAVGADNVGTLRQVLVHFVDQESAPTAAPRLLRLA